MHYTQQPSLVTSQTNGSATMLCARLQGFIDAAMLRAELDDWDQRFGARLPGALLLDLREVVGYGPGTPSLARAWLLGVPERGVARIAFVAGSSVVRTIVSVISPDAAVQLRCFLSDEAAVDWLEGRPVTAKSAQQRRRAPTASMLPNP